eukprot:g10801.t1
MGGWWHLFLRRAWLVAPLLLSVVTKAADAPEGGAAVPPAMLLADDLACWVFNYMNKSGGKSVTVILMAWWKRHNAGGSGKKSLRLTMRWYDNVQWREGEAFARYVSQRSTVSVGAYTQGLLAHEARPCKWLTMFRHPVHRLASAFFYCKIQPGDPLCATVALDARTADLGTFAKHWRNFGVCQFLLAFVPREDVSEADVVDNICTTDCSKENQCPGCSTALAEPWMHQFLWPVEELLSHKYAAVGLLEELDVTLVLFNATLQLPGLDWVASFQEIGTKNADRHFALDKAKAVAQAWTDPDIQAYLWLDILLYDHAVGVFHRQAEAHG